MRFLAVPGLLLLLTSPLIAQQEDDGTIRVESPNSDAVLDIAFLETEAIPGQALTLRMTVLVPTYLPEPPVWPSLEAPNLLVRLPERSTNPTSARVEGETWSGVTRAWSISPMVPGTFSIPPQEVIVTYADPDTNAPVKATLRTEMIGFSGVLPEGAEGLDPFLAAEALELEQTVTGEPGAMVPGDSVTRTVVAKVFGTSPMFLPGLLGVNEVEGVAAYPDEPKLVETAERGKVGGSRMESVTLVAEGGGSGEESPVSIDWYNLSTGKVETATVEGFAIAVDGPPVGSSEPLDWRKIASAGLLLLVGVLVTVWLLRRVTPELYGMLAARKEARLASERHAYAGLGHAVSKRDHAGLRPALDLWAGRVAGPDPRDDPHVLSALTALGKARYGKGAPISEVAAWREVSKALANVRNTRRVQFRLPYALPSLNT